jgi:hypothetical protein
MHSAAHFCELTLCTGVYFEIERVRGAGNKLHNERGAVIAYDLRELARQGAAVDDQHGLPRVKLVNTHFIGCALFVYKCNIIRIINIIFY